MSKLRQLLVMLVDDGQGLAETLAPRIRALGHRVRAVQLPAAMPVARSSTPDVVVLSLQLGEADAVELGRGLCEHAGARTPLVVAFADPDDPDANHRAGDIGAHLVLLKPIEVAVLAGVLRRFGDLLVGVEG